MITFALIVVYILFLLHCYKKDWAVTILENVQLFSGVFARTFIFGALLPFGIYIESWAPISGFYHRWSEDLGEYLGIVFGILFAVGEVVGLILFFMWLGS